MFVFVQNVNRLPANRKGRNMAKKSTGLAATVVAVIKLARSKGYGYVDIATYYRINQGRIADVMKGRIGPDIAPAKSLPSDFPALA